MSSLENYPLEPPPPGQTSNFINPRDRGPAITTLCSVFVSFMWIFYLLRFYSKVWVLRTYGWEDASAMLAAVGTTSYAALTIWAMRILGPHAWNVRAVNFSSRLVQLDTVMDLVYNPAIFFAKLALFLLYFRIFSSDRRTRIGIYFGIVIGCLFYTSADIVFLITCVPRRGVKWLSPEFAAQCTPATNMNYVQGIFGVVSDIYIFILPLPVLWKLQMPLRKKIGITAIFVTGLMAIVASALGLYYRALLAMDYSDNAWRQPPVLGLTTMEMALGVICSSVPHLPPLFRHHAAFFSRVSHWLHSMRPSYKILPRMTSDLPLHGLSNPKHKASEPQRMIVETRLLGSIQGDGHFIRLSRFFGSKFPKVPSGSATLVNSDDATRRDYYETAI